MFNTSFGTTFNSTLNAQTQNHHSAPQDDSVWQRDFHGAAIIDSQGREIPMTAEMIDRTLDQLSLEMDKQKKSAFTAF